MIKKMNNNQFNLQNANYRSVTIGDQVWMAENLNVDTFRNGDSIPHAETEEEWKAAGEQGKPAWCCYNNDPENGKKYGKLYNWYAVNDPRGLAPEGWHISTDRDWRILIDFLGGDDIAAKKLKAKAGWENIGHGSENVSCNGTDDFGFTGLPGGLRWSNGSFGFAGNYGYWWSSSEYSVSDAWSRGMGSNDCAVFRGDDNKTVGFSVRCLKASESLINN